MMQNLRSDMLTLSKTSENVSFYFMSSHSKLDKNFTETTPHAFLLQNNVIQVR